METGKNAPIHEKANKEPSKHNIQNTNKSARSEGKLQEKKNTQAKNAELAANMKKTNPCTRRMHQYPHHEHYESDEGGTPGEELFNEDCTDNLKETLKK